MSVRLLLPLVFASFVVACGSSEGDSGDTVPPPSTSPAPGSTASPTPGSGPAAVDTTELPWEVISNKGEAYLPNVFYADASQNEQIMPWALDGHTQIDRLIYPTLGNPNLYTKDDITDEFTSVLRVEDTAWDFLHVTPQPIDGSPLLHVDIPNDPQSGFVFFLVSRSARTGNTEATTPISSGDGTGVYRVYPNDIYMNPIPANMPETLKARKTLRFVFRQGAMSKVPAGLYDLRMEVRQANALYQPGLYEYQYNAVRVFDTEPEEYQAINITDTQVSVGDLYGAKTADKLSQLVQFINTTNDSAIRNASFITFNGDLHNGGSPGSLRQRPVATTYAEEAKTIVNTLKYLPAPIFLTIGNHDGYVSTGHVPSAVKALDTAVLDNLDSVISDAQPKAWPNYNEDDFHAYIDKTNASDQLGGVPLDIFTGSFTRTPSNDFSGWKEVARTDRNFILYDGFYQWQKTYGPLNYSWTFGKNHYVSMNSFELRQHRRSGWGMYTVNYGGGMSNVQMAWLDRELARSQTTGNDVILLAHHDPRGGHHSEDQGYYFEQVDYSSIYQSAINYIVAQEFDPTICKLPDWALPREENENCIHDGLQEWMRPDPTLDGSWASGIELMTRIAKATQVRTLLLGHTHYNQLEVLQNGDDLLPGQFTISNIEDAQKFATLEVQNPMRAFSFLQKDQGRTPDYDIHALPLLPVAARNQAFTEVINPLLAKAPHTLDSPSVALPRELVVLRLVSNADLTDQTVKSDGATALGFAILSLSKKSDGRQITNAQINGTTFYVNSGSNVFTNVKTIALDRTAHLAPHDAANPIQQLYNW